MKNLFLEKLREKVIVLDGALGTSLQKLNLTPDDFGGKDGCNEYLVVTKPDAVRGVHASYFEAGCDAVETDSFGASRTVLSEYGLEDHVVELNEKAARLAKEVAEEFSTKAQPRFVVGSIGPGTKLPSLGHISTDELKAEYKEQMRGLIQGGADVFLIETCQDLLQTKTAIIAAEEVFAQTKTRLPVMAQVTFETTGTMLLGTDMASVVATLEMFPIDVIGMNCATGPKEMADHIRYLCDNSIKNISVLPNAGMPENVDGCAHYHLKPEELADYHERFVKEFGVSIVGGCCGTTPEHLKAVADRVGRMNPKRRKVARQFAVSSLYTASNYKQDPPPFMIGEQTNSNGSRNFRKIIEAEDYEAAVSVARKAEKEGIHAIDVSVECVGRDQSKDMIEVISRYNQYLTVPIMVDSTNPEVLDVALKRIAGKPIINSINLEDGEEKMAEICPLARKYGAALVALTIDEEGMAKTTEKKFEVAERIYVLATKKYGICPEDLFFDALAFTIGSGDEDSRDAAIQTLDAIKQIKKKLPGANTVLGLSNISFGLAPGVRQILNSVFMKEAVDAGLDAAIVHARKIIPFFKIDKEDVELARNLIYNKWSDKKDPLQIFLKHFESKEGTGAAQETVKKATTIEEVVKNRIIDGDKEGLEADLEEARKKYSPLEIINNLLLEGMKVVGELFGEGKTQLPFVLQSAEVMKTAVAFLEPYMEKGDDTAKGKILLATVKGDVHDIGKNLVGIILSNNGYKVYDIGIKQSLEQILMAAEKYKVDAIGLSGLLVKSTQIMKEDLEEMKRRGISVPVICGGAALTPKYVEEDLNDAYGGTVYYGRDAFSSLRVMDKITSGQKAIEPGQKKTASTSAKKKALKQEEKSQKEKLVEVIVSTKSKVSPVAKIPKPPFWGSRVFDDIPLEDVFPWLNKLSLFKSQWKFKQGKLSNEEYEEILKTKVEPLFGEITERCIKEGILKPRVVYAYYPCYGESNDIVILDERGKKEISRFTFPRQKKKPFHCLSDFLCSRDSGKLDVIGFMAVTVGSGVSERESGLLEKDRYTDYFYLHGLSVETAEALAEYVHKLMRQDLNIDKTDGSSLEEIFAQGYQGARYSFGYPACPSLEDQKKLFDLIPVEKIGITLTDEYLMVPEQSVSAIMLHHPEANYFSV